MVVDGVESSMTELGFCQSSWVSCDQKGLCVQNRLKEFVVNRTPISLLAVSFYKRL